MNLKGTLPTLILNALATGPNHGYRIAQQIKAQSDGVLNFTEGTLYPALHRLEHNGLVESYVEAENGRPRRYYRITRAGRAALKQDRTQWQALSGAVTSLLEPEQ